MCKSNTTSDYRDRTSTADQWVNIPTAGVCPTCGHCPTCGRRHPPYPPSPYPFITYTPTPGSFIFC